MLNGHDYDEGAESNTIRPDCVARLNKVIESTDCQIVISSAWRYMVLNGAMTLEGFTYLLRTHGLHVVSRVIGVLPEDTGSEDPNERATLIKLWLVKHKHPSAWAVVDDLFMTTLTSFVQTDPGVGLQDEDADHLIKLLRLRT